MSEERFSFPREEERILQHWNDIDAFQTSLKLTEGKPEFSFFDGPPFATGTPHYGHILASTTKDIVPRYATMNGYHVERRFGWDTHGLPIEHIIDKKLNITCKEDVFEYGLDNYNDECRKIVMTYADEWRKTIGRVGRWIDSIMIIRPCTQPSWNLVGGLSRNYTPKTKFTEVTKLCHTLLVVPHH